VEIRKQSTATDRPVHSNQNNKSKMGDRQRRNKRRWPRNNRKRKGDESGGVNVNTEGKTGGKTLSE
jgi:hypothetical protein